MDDYGKLPKVPDEIKIKKFREIMKCFFYKLTTDKNNWSKGIHNKTKISHNKCKIILKKYCIA